WNEVGIFGVHVAQADGVACLATVEAAFLCKGYAIVEAERVDHGGAHAARSRRPDDDDAVAAEEGQIGSEVRPEEARRLLLSDHYVFRTGGDHRDDLVAVDGIVGAAPRLLAAGALPPPAAGVPIVGAALPGGVDDRQPLGARPLDQRLDVFE